MASAGPCQEPALPAARAATSDPRATQAAEKGTLIRRPPTTDNCDQCPDPDSVTCAISPPACETCWLTCGEVPGSPPRRLRPAGPTVDPWLPGGYTLAKEIGVTQLSYEPFDPTYGPNRLTSFATNLELAEEVRSYGFRTLKIWMNYHPLDGLGEPFCYDLFDTGRGDWWCETDTVEWDSEAWRYTSDPDWEDMREFWARAPVDQIFVRFERWMLEEARGIDGTSCNMMHRAPYYEIAMQLYRWIGWRDITIVFTDWEQDWQVLGCGTQDGSMPDMSWVAGWSGCLEGEAEPECRARAVDLRLDFVLSVIEDRQEQVERARRDAWTLLGRAPALRIMHGVTLNRHPWNVRPHEAGLPKLAERIAGLERSPDLLLISYWLRDVDPKLVLDWYAETTGYPRHRFAIDEFGSRVGTQAQRFEDYLRAFDEWGVKTVNIWMWKQTWCGDPHLGLWERHEPCAGRVIFTGPADGLEVLRRTQLEWDRR